MRSLVEHLRGFVQERRQHRLWTWWKAIAASLLLVCLVLGRHRLIAEYHYFWIVAHVSSSSMVGHMGELQALQDDSAIPPLLRLSRSSSPMLRSFAAQTLGKYKGDRVVDALVRLAREDPGMNTQAVAIASLGTVADPRALPFLSEHSCENSWALGALGHFGETGKQTLLAQVRGGCGPSWRADALLVLCGPAWERVPPADPEIHREARARLADSAWQVRAAAAQCVAKMPGAARPEWLPRLLEDAEPMVRLAAASELGKLGDRSGLEAASRILADETLDQEVRARAALTLKDVRDPRVRGLLCAVIRSGAPFRVEDMCKTALANLFHMGTVYKESMCNEAADPRQRERPPS